ncbi:hypothetical protein [Helicobacter trogontum]|uniref:hypothetical protein n=1 Tax=Helicobacter trogontum TaxID=50960 RepID=UPI000CF0624B|nr:hypothetical protein [Helicobacter trogontum]
MDLNTLEKMGDEEMAGKIASISAVLKIFGGHLLGKIASSPLKFARLLKFSFKIKKEVDKTKDEQDMGKKIDNTLVILKIVLDYRKTNPNEMEVLFEMLEEIVQKYQENPNMKQEILNLIEMRGR